MNKIIIIAGIIIIIIAIVIIAVFVMGGDDGDDNQQLSGQIQVPINFKGAENVGSIGIELQYDSTIIEAIDVENGEFSSDAMVEFNISNPGLVIIGIVDSAGITGNGAIAVVSFDVLENKGTSTLAFTNLQTHDATTLIDIINTGIDGSFNSESNTFSAPVIHFTD